jgi:hypothetical protein
MSVPRNRVLVGIGVVAVVVVLVLFLRPGDGPADRPEESATPGQANDGIPSHTIAGPDVPPVDTCQVLELEEIDVALGLTELPVNQRSFFTFSRDEGCEWRHDDGSAEGGNAIRIEPGDPADFLPDAQLSGVGARDVVDLGLAAAWYGATSNGVLSVASESAFGYLFVRIGVDRPDIGDEERLEVARDVVAIVLPRMPGMEAARPDPEDITVQHDPPDTARQGLVGNLLARVGDGDWSRGEGLVATLGMLLDEVDVRAVLRHTDLDELEMTGIVEMAREYIEQPEDPSLGTEIAGLLERLTLTTEELEEMSGIGSPTAAPAWAPAVIAQAAENCGMFYGHDITGVGFCLEFETVEVEGRLYRVFYPAPSVPSGGWTAADYRLAVDAVRESVPVLNRFGQTPETNLVFSIIERGFAFALYDENAPCIITFARGLQEEAPAAIKQIIAHELTHCFAGETYPPQKRVMYQFREWWEEGLANYLSNVVYPDTNVEFDSVALLESEELASTLFERAYSNSMFFQHLENRFSANRAAGLIASLADSGGLAEQEVALANVADMATTLQSFEQDMTDGSIIDTSGLPIPFDPDAETYVVDAPQHIVPEVRPFGLVRLHLIVPGGQFACMDVGAGDTTLWAWRHGAPGAPGVEGPWELDLPDAVSGEIVLVATSTARDATFIVSVTDVAEEPDCVDPSTAPADLECPGLCGPSRFYRSGDQIPEPLRSLFGGS